MLVNLTDRTIKQYIAKWQHDPKPYELRDTTIRGLCLRMGSVSRTWCIHVVISRKAYRVKLGTWPCITAEEARRRALDWLYRHREQWNEGRLCKAPALVTTPASSLTDSPTPAPADTPAAVAATSATFAQVLTLYLQHKTLKPLTQRSYSDALKFHLKDLAQQPVSQLTGSLVSTLYKQLLTTLKPATANLQIRVLRALHRFWFAYNDQSAPDVFSTLKTLGSRQKSAVRTRYLSESDLKTLGQHWHLLTQAEQDFMQIALCTGFRLSELKSLTPQSYDPIRHTLHLPTTKNGKPHTLPVAEWLRPTLERLCNAGNKHLLSGHLHNYASIISRKTSMTFSCHDLRRTFATHATKLGIAAYMVKALLNHTDSADVTATHYVHLHVDDLVSAVQSITVAFQTLLIIINSKNEQNHYINNRISSGCM